MSGRIETRKWASAIGFSATPMLIATVPLLWFSSQSGVRWAYSLFGKDHPLNFGGNPSEVLSHLLNWILMTLGCSGGLGASLIATSLLKSEPGWQSRFAVVPAAIFGFSLSGLLFWTGFLDYRFGEGAVVMSFVLFFGPATALSATAALRLLTSRASLRKKLVQVIALFVLAISFQWIYEHSGSGGPNVLVLPLLFIQVWAWSYFSKRLNRKYPGDAVEGARCTIESRSPNL